ncbi:TRIO and F-actin-binding protein-like [Mugil cephalus]|uniref:TRIO and F-actin-binding protein-like n=1 Tax=Mugil cephalus TaxID=48193 RepID=UPI001FB6BF2E|nr:TRIO and F-actin-binding protein-like [Mugil cephalus]
MQQNSYERYQASPRTRTALNSSINTRTRNSREVSPSRNGFSTHSHTSKREVYSRDGRLSTSQGSSQGSSHSLLSLPPSRGSSSSRQGADSLVLGASLSHVANTETDKCNEGSDRVNGDRSGSNIRRGMEALLISESKKAAVEVEEVGMTIDDYIMLADIPKIQLESEEEYPGLRRRNQSPSPCRNQRLRSYRYQDEKDVYSSRLDSDERGRGRERGRDRREKCQDSGNGRSSRSLSVASLYAESSDNKCGKHRSSRVKERAPECPLTQGWLSRLDEHGQWRKHWFILGDTSLKYYRDSEAEESDDLDGEIDLASCLSVSEYDIEKSYGLQIQTKKAVFTLSAMTSRIQRNWVKLLKQAIEDNTQRTPTCRQSLGANKKSTLAPASHPEQLQKRRGSNVSQGLGFQSRCYVSSQSETGNKKENPCSHGPLSCQPPAPFTCKDSGYEPATSNSTTKAANSHHAGHHHQTVDGDQPASQREEGKSLDRKQAKRLEERNKWFEEGVSYSEMGSRWDSMELKKGSVPLPVIETMDTEVSRKWAEFESLSFRDTSSQFLIGAQANQSCTPEVLDSLTGNQNYHSDNEETEQSATSPVNGVQIIQTNTAEALQKEAASLRKQVESIKRERAAMGIEVESPCGPGAPCRVKLEAMEVAHRKALQELQEKHTREMKELEEQKHRIVQEKSQIAAQDMEALRATHRETLDREMEKAMRLSGGAALMDSSHRECMPRADVLRSELDVLTERFSEKCLELSRTEQHSKGRETELTCKERELEQLRKENQDLKAKLAEEISRMRSFITGHRRVDVVSLCNTECTASKLETLLRAKENEVQYLKKEISCLQNEVQSLTKEKEAAYERFKEAYVELSDMRGRSQLEVGSLNEHLRLANAALQEGKKTHLTNEDNL